VTPYLCYARADRRTEAGGPITNRYVAQLVETSGIDALITIDVHNLAALENAYRCRTLNPESSDIVADHFAPECAGARVVVVSPDSGGIRRAERLRQALARRVDVPVGTAFVEKLRDAGIRGDRLTGDVRDATVLIVDDIISTGATLAHAARVCAGAGARRVLAAAAHGLFAGNAVGLLRESAIERLAVLDAVPPHANAVAGMGSRLCLLGSAPLVATAIRRQG